MLKLLVKKQIAEVFRSYYYDAKKNRMRSKWAIAGWIVFFVVIMVGMLGGMFTGFFSVNQSSAVGCFLAFIIMIVMMIVRREFSVKAAWEKTPEGAFSEKIFSLDRRIYHPRYTDEAE